MACQHGSAPNWVQWGEGHNLYNVRSSIGTGSLLSPWSYLDQNPRSTDLIHQFLFHQRRSDQNSYIDLGSDLTKRYSNIPTGTPNGAKIAIFSQHLALALMTAAGPLSGGVC